MEKEEYIKHLQKNIKQNTRKLFNLADTKQLLRPDSAVFIWELTLSIRTLAVLTEKPTKPLMKRLAKATSMTDDELNFFSELGEWITLDRSTRNMSEDEYSEFWNDATNHPVRRAKATHSLEAMKEIGMLNELWAL
jgi:hypothetical protein